MVGRGGGHTRGGGLLVGGTVHGELAHVLVGMEDDDVDLGREKAKQRHIGTQRNGHAQSGDLDLWQAERTHEL